MLKKQKALFGNKSGMTLVEVLVAITILMLVLFCVTPLFVNNLNTIKLSGDKAVTIYKNAGIMQKVLGNIETGDENSNVGYDVDVANVPLSLNGNGKTYSVSAQGDLIASSPADLQQGFATLVSDAPDSNFQVFPKSLTDDFKEAYLTVAAIGFSFADEPGSSVYKLYCHKEGVETPLKYGEDYIMRRVQSSDPEVQNRVMQIVLYGGTDVNFSNSPLTFKYKGYSKDIQVDAPSMIMVGEKSTDGYRYYVSRGETEKDSNGNDRLIVLEREMHDAPLTSAMNDVEWVSAEDADDYAKNEDQSKYGYYIMGGDNGQIRRFWKNTTTGNYYWGGDYTYYTDIEYNRVDGEKHFSATKYKGTSVSYKFLAKRGLNNGFNLGNKNGKISLQNRNLWSVTALGDDALDTIFYGSDGKLFYYYMKKHSETLPISNVGQFDNAITNILNRRDGKSNEVNWSKDLREVERLAYQNHESYAWLKADKNSYYDINGIKGSVDKDSYPITITSVGAIVLTGSGAYETDVRNGSYDLDTSDTKYGNATLSDDLSYPKSTYNLYCGYIPAVMDLWTTDVTDDKRGTDFYGGQVTGEINSGYNGYKTMTSKVLSNGSVARISSTLQGSEVEKNILWKGTFGMTPYLTRGTSLSIDGTGQTAWEGKVTAYVAFAGYKDWHDYMGYWPYTNLGYAVTGKFYDSSTPAGTPGTYPNINLMEHLVYSLRKSNALPSAFVKSGSAGAADKQLEMTNGKVVDVTIAYLSHPLAIHLAANPTDGKAFAVQNYEFDMNSIAHIWNNRRENTTILDIASTRIPSAGGKDIPVSLAVGYTMGGIVEYDNNKNAYVNTVMNNGIVYIRAGSAYIDKAQISNAETNEYYATDKDGYKLAQESNYFHQFYFIDTKLLEKEVANCPVNDDTRNYTGGWADLDQYQSTFGHHTGDMYGARFWENNRHIQYLAIGAGVPDYNDHNQNKGIKEKDAGGNGNNNYLRSHPLHNTKVTCVCWGTTWDNNPQAMWGTANGTLLSWYVDLNKAKDLEDESDYYTQNGKVGVFGADMGGKGTAKAQKAAEWNAISTVAEFQNYEWIENVSNKAFSVTADTFKWTIGAHAGNKNGTNWGNPSLQTFSVTNVASDTTSSFHGFYDRTTQECKLYQNSYSFVSTLSCINDIEYANDYWVAVGNQSGKRPQDYCGSGTLPNPSNREYGGSTGALQAYSNTGDGSWVNVRYWWDKENTGKASETNDHYLWKAVKISNNPNYNIVQINCLNGVWYATGYEDANESGEWDPGEKAVICWATDPLAACDAKDGLTKPAAGRWSENVQFYRTTGKGQYTAMSATEVGGINSVACRDDV